MSEQNGNIIHVNGVHDAKQDLTQLSKKAVSQLLRKAAGLLQECVDEVCERIQDDVSILRHQSRHEAVTARLEADCNAETDRLLVRLEAEHRVLEHLAAKKRTLTVALEDKKPGPGRDSLERQLAVLTRHEEEVMTRCKVWATDVPPALPAPEADEPETKKTARKKD